MKPLTLDTVHRLHIPNANHGISTVVYHLEQYAQTRDYAHLEIAQQFAQNTQRSVSAVAHYLEHTGE